MHVSNSRPGRSPQRPSSVVKSPLRLLLYAAVPDEQMLSQGFYAAEAEGLRAHPEVASVAATNRLRNVATETYDGLITYFYSHSAAATLIARLRGRRAVATGGGEQLFANLAASRWRYRLRLLAFHLTTMAASRLLATSTTDLTQMRKLALFGQNKIALSYHGAPAVDASLEKGGSFQLASPDARASRPPASLITICGLDTEQNVRRKGVLEAVDLLARFREYIPAASLTIIGRTTRQDMVEERARLGGVADGVRFAGYVSEEQKLALLDTHRFYIQLSEYEGFGIGALEALARGCHIIHSGAGGLRDTVASYGTVLRPEEVGSADIPALIAAAEGSSADLNAHLVQFTTRARADSIIAALREMPSR